MRLWRVWLAGLVLLRDFCSGYLCTSVPFSPACGVSVAVRVWCSSHVPPCDAAVLRWFAVVPVPCNIEEFWIGLETCVSCPPSTPLQGCVRCFQLMFALCPGVKVAWLHVGLTSRVCGSCPLKCMSVLRLVPSAFGWSDWNNCGVMLPLSSGYLQSLLVPMLGGC